MSAASIAADEPRREEWLTPGVGGIGAASLLADLGHEVPTALLPASWLAHWVRLRPRSD